MTTTERLARAVEAAAKLIASEGGVPDHYVMPRRTAEQMGLMDCVSHAVTHDGDFIPIEDCIDPGGVVAVASALIAQRRSKEPK